MTSNRCRFRKLISCVHLISGFIAFSNCVDAQTTAAAGNPAAPRSRSPMMDALILELMKGEPINDIQAKQVVNKEFGAIWNDHHLVDSPDSKEVREGRFQAGIYLAAVKASLLDIDNHGGWPMYYGNLREPQTVRLILAELKSKALAPSDKVNRTLINYAIIVPAWLENDKEAIEKSDLQRTADWPGDSYITRKAARLKAWAKSEHPKE